MKLLSFLTLLLLGFVCSLQAQNEFTFGVKGGMNASHMLGDGYGGYNKIGVNAGLFVQREIENKPLCFRLEMNYSSKGSVRQPDFDRGIFYFKIAANYIDLPLIFLYDYKNISLYAGLTPTVLINSKVKDDFGTRIGQVPFYRVNVELPLGLEYPLKEKLNMGARYSTSLLSSAPRHNLYGSHISNWMMHQVVHFYLAKSF